MSDTTAKRSIAKQVEEHVRSGVCLVCKAEAVRRGLCMNHYQFFLRRLKSKGSDVERAEFESACIREGKILAVGRMREIKQDDPFAGVQ